MVTDRVNLWDIGIRLSNPFSLLIGFRNPFLEGREFRGFRGVFVKIKTGLVDKDTGRPLNTEGNPKSMKYLDLCSYEYSKVVSLLINQVAKEYKVVYSGSQTKTIEVVMAVMYQLLTTEYPLRISKTALCSSNTMKGITDRLDELYPRLFKCLRGFPTLRGNVPSVITWNHGVRENFLKDVMKYYHSTGVVFKLNEYEVPVVDDVEAEKRYLANKAKFNNVSI